MKAVVFGGSGFLGSTLNHYLKNSHIEPFIFDNFSVGKKEFLEIDVWKKFSNILNSNVIGKVLHVNISWIVQTYSFANNTNSWKVNLNSGGGVINNFSPHVFHYIENIFGKIDDTELTISQTETTRSGETNIGGEVSVYMSSKDAFCNEIDFGDSLIIRLASA